MVFSSTIFLFLFFPILVLLYYCPIIKSVQIKNGILLFASLLFYAWGEPIYVFLMLFSVLMTYFFGYGIGSCIAAHKKIVLILGITYHICVLFIFKYMSFVLLEIDKLLDLRYPIIEISLPIGISFYTFQMLSYLFDVYYRNANVQKNVFRLALYVSFFPQLIAGPIVRYQQIEHDLNHRVLNNAQNFTEGMERFVYGLGKKVLISNYLAYIATTIFSSHSRSVASAWWGGVCYTLQIFFDFSGYSDMAIGLGRIFGFHFPENFNYPYISKSVTEFWRRWHISLSTWFKDYVYIPLGGNRVSKGKWIRNLFVVWLLTGIWHGANWTFLIWGVSYFFILLIEKLTGFTQKMHFLGHAYTLIVVIAEWVIFRSETMKDACSYLGNMIGIGSNGILDALFFEMIHTGIAIVIIGCILSTPIYGIVLGKIDMINPKVGSLVRTMVCTTVFFLSLIEVITSTYSPFIYFNF